MKFLLKALCVNNLKTQYTKSISFQYCTINISNTTFLLPTLLTLGYKSQIYSLQSHTKHRKPYNQIVTFFSIHSIMKKMVLFHNFFPTKEEKDRAILIVVDVASSNMFIWWKLGVYHTFVLTLGTFSK